MKQIFKPAVICACVLLFFAAAIFGLYRLLQPPAAAPARPPSYSTHKLRPPAPVPPPAPPRPRGDSAPPGPAAPPPNAGLPPGISKSGPEDTAGSLLQLLDRNKPQRP